MSSLLRIKLMNSFMASLLSMISLPVLVHASNMSPVIKDSTIAITNLNANPLIDFNPEQKRSYHLLMRHFTQCYQYIIEPYDNEILNSNVEITIHEKHNIACGGDPHTFPRVASYAIDKYGRIFEYRTIDDTYHLQYRFNEHPVWMNDVTHFKHPTKSVLDKYSIDLQRLEKRANNSFVIFYVSDTPLLLKSGKDTSDVYADLRQQLFTELLAANGDWDFMIRLEYGGEYYIEGSKRKIIDEDSYLYPFSAN